MGVSRAFGPTYAGDDLRYPGVWFSFEEDGRGEPVKTAPSHPEEKMQEVKRVIVSQKSAIEEPDDVLSELRVCETMHGDIESAIVKVCQTLGIPTDLRMNMALRFTMACY